MSLAVGCERQERDDDSNTDPGATDADGEADGSGDSNEGDGDYCTLVEDGPGPSGGAEVTAEEVAADLEVPWGVAFVDTDTMLVTERPGRLRLVDGGELVDEPLAEVDVDDSGEAGLLGIALDPEFDENGRFFMYMTVEEDGDSLNRVESWTFDDSGDEPSASRDEVVVDDIPADTIHDGGRLRVGPDDMLYIGTGDAGEPDRSQDEDSLAGKVLRVTPEGEVPEDNPIEDNPVYISGIRNTQGFDWRDDSTMYVVDHGPSGEMGRTGHDEANVAEAGDNLGWPDIYGCEDEEGMRPPSLTWEQAVPPGGAAVYDGEAIGEWQGDLIMGILGARHLHRVSFEEDSPRVEEHEVYMQGDPSAGGLGRVRDVIMGPDDELYVTTSNCDGRGNCPDDGDKILRIVPEE
ncbi:MAG: PQQ-dependent sugar dehydrogenase [Persicimonas sp.]